MVAYTIIKTEVILVDFKIDDFSYDSVNTPEVKNEATCIFDNSKGILVSMICIISIIFLKLKLNRKFIKGFLLINTYNVVNHILKIYA